MAGDLTFLFWNLARQPLHAEVANIARAEAVDIVMLAECEGVPEQIKALGDRTGNRYREPFTEFDRVRVLTKFSSRFIKPVFENDRLSIRRLRLPARPEFVFVVAHLRSKLHRTGGSQEVAAPLHAAEIARVERQVGHHRTLLVGDLNMNPFEPGMVGAGAFHATPHAEIAREGVRRVDGNDHRYFFTPMWRLLGESDPAKPRGTYYRRGSDHVEYFWHTFDQVLVRPDLLDAFCQDSLTILTSDGQRDLVDRNSRPARHVASDHLPLLFRIRI